MTRDDNTARALQASPRKSAAAIADAAVAAATAPVPPLAQRLRDHNIIPAVLVGQKRGVHVVRLVNKPPPNCPKEFDVTRSWIFPLDKKVTKRTPEYEEFQTRVRHLKAPDSMKVRIGRWEDVIERIAPQPLKQSRALNRPPPIALIGERPGAAAAKRKKRDKDEQTQRPRQPAVAPPVLDKATAEALAADEELARELQRELATGSLRKRRAPPPEAEGLADAEKEQPGRTKHAKHSRFVPTSAVVGNTTDEGDKSEVERIVHGRCALALNLYAENAERAEAGLPPLPADIGELARAGFVPFYPPTMEQYVDVPLPGRPVDITKLGFPPPGEAPTAVCPVQRSDMCWGVRQSAMNAKYATYAQNLATQMVRVQMAKADMARF